MTTAILGGPGKPAPGPHSIFTFAFCATSAQRLVSEAIWAANCSWLDPTGSTPSFFNCSITGGSRMIACVSDESLATISFGTPEGAKKPCQELAS